jgi:hypothetical protein
MDGNYWSGTEYGRDVPGLPPGYNAWCFHSDNGAQGYLGKASPLYAWAVRDGDVAPIPEAISLDIKPQSCPNPLNTKSKGVLPVAILGTFDFDITNIDPASIRLAYMGQEVAPIRSSVEDVSTPLSNLQNDCECTEQGGDGLDDLTLKFNTQDIVAILGQVTDGEVLELTLTGVLTDNTPIEGKDCIIVLSKGGKGKPEEPDECYGGVPKTGQTESFAPGDDGDLQKGEEWPDPRFFDNGDGTVTDYLTGLIWLKNANCIATTYPAFDNDDALGDGQVTWQHALDFVTDINGGIYTGCGAGYTDWRLPNIRELLSLIDYGRYGPPLPSGHPFTGAQLSYYWSSTTLANFSDNAWHVHMFNGYVFDRNKVSIYCYVWPVRDGN